MVPNHVILLGNPNVASQTTTTSNLATLLSDLEGDSVLQHDCLVQPLKVPDWESHTDGNSFMEKGQQRTRFGLPNNIQDDNRSLQEPSSTSEISQNVGQALQIQWKLHAS